MVVVAAIIVVMAVVIIMYLTDWISLFTFFSKLVSITVFYGN